MMNQKAMGGELVQENSISNCTDHCLSLSQQECTGVNFDLNTNQCWIIKFNYTQSDLEETPGFVNYRRVEDCGIVYYFR